MARRVDESYQERRQQIIDGALRVFAAKGFEKATNKEIADAAGIGSPGLIYHYFKNKEDLLFQIADQRLPLLHLITQPDEIMALPPEQALERIGRAYLRILELPDALAMFRLIVGEAVRLPEFTRVFNELAPNRALSFITIYLSRQMDAGALRREDPNLAARTFFAPLVFFIQTREIFRQPEALSLDPEVVLRTNLRLFLRAMRPSDGEE